MSFRKKMVSVAAQILMALSRRLVFYQQFFDQQFGKRPCRPGNIPPGLRC
jgi:hypothetical protein